MKRRVFLGGAGATAIGSIFGQAASPSRSVSPSDKITLALMGVGGRGINHAELFAALPDVNISCICDVDKNVVEPAMKIVEKAKGSRPKLIEDIRYVLDDKSVDAVAMATPHHWHAAGTILACEAGKDVYVEKPASHNIREGRLMVEAARRNKRIVQVGGQSRSSPLIQSFVKYARSGKIGDLLMAKVLNNDFRPSIGHKPDEPVPPGINYDLWTGPVTLLPFNRNRFHRTAAWTWHYGTGEVADNGAHWLDICRWVLDVGCPTETSGMGRKLRFDDDKETPDTESIQFNYKDKMILWEGRSWTPYGLEGSQNTVIVYGTEGEIQMGRWVRNCYAFRHFDAKGELVHYEQEEAPDQGIRAHVRNFTECMRSRNVPSHDIEIGHISTTICHLGNIAIRTNRTIKYNPSTETIIDDPQASQYAAGEYYREHWSSKPFRKA